MIKKHNIILLLVVIFSFISNIFYDIGNFQDYSAIVTYLSILTGFFMAAFSSIFSSKVVLSLYTIKDSENPSITLKHRLKNYFLFSFDFAICSILFMLLFPDTVKLPFVGYIITKREFVIPILLSNSVLYYFIIRYLGKIFIKNSSEC